MLAPKWSPVLTLEELESRFSSVPSAQALLDSRPVGDYPKLLAGAVLLTQHQLLQSFSWIFQILLEFLESDFAQKLSTQAFCSSGTSDPN